MAGTISCFGIISPWRRCFPGKAGSATHTHLERAKSHAVDDVYLLARASRLQAGFRRDQDRFEEAKFESLRVLDMFEKLGTAYDVEETKRLLGRIDRDARGNETSDESDDGGECLETMLTVVCI